MTNLPTVRNGCGRGAGKTPGITARLLVAASLLVSGSAAVMAQDLRYSWFEVSFVSQDIDKDGSMTQAAIGQTIDASTSDGNGIKFRASVGTWNNLFAFVDFNSSDIDVNALVSNAQGQFPAKDNFDFTSIRGGLGYKWSLSVKTDIFAAASFDSTDLDFGSFAGENFDSNDKDLGGMIGIRAMIGDKLELRAQVRYSGVGDVDLSRGQYDNDTLYGAGFGYQLVRGLSITADYESGEFSSWNIGFRLDLDEN